MSEYATDPEDSSGAYRVRDTSAKAKVMPYQELHDLTEQYSSLSITMLNVPLRTNAVHDVTPFSTSRPSSCLKVITKTICRHEQRLLWPLESLHRYEFSFWCMRCSPNHLLCWPDLTHYSGLAAACAEYQIASNARSIAQSSLYLYKSLKSAHKSTPN